jgi:biotin carboxyl carrier protein
MDLTYISGSQAFVVSAQAAPDGFTVTINGESFAHPAALPPSGGILLTSGGRQHRALVAADGPRRWVWTAGRTFVFTIPDAGRKPRRGGAGGHDSLEARMPGVVRKVLVQPGDAVERGQVLVLMEAMKMEIRLSAPHAGVVERVSVAEGQTVERGQVLVEVAAKAEA